MPRRIALLMEGNPAARAVLLEKHGLVTWGASGEESYRTTIEIVTRASRAIELAAAGRVGLGGPARSGGGEGRGRSILLPPPTALRGAPLCGAARGDLEGVAR